MSGPTSPWRAAARSILSIFRKESVDHFRDRRSLTSALISPLLGPIVLSVMLSLLASWNRQDKPLTIPVKGREHAPNFVAFLERHGAVVVDAPADYDKQVEEGKLDLTIVIPDDYADDFVKGETPRLQLVVDNSRQQSAANTRRARRLLAAYVMEIGTLRMYARGLSPTLANPVQIDEVDLATSAKQAGNLLNAVPYFLLLAVFMGGMHLAIDSTAGERERGSLEPLLLNPVSRGVLVAGKWLSVVLVTWLAAAVCLIAFMVLLRRLPLEDLGVRVSIGGRELAGIVAALLPLTFFTAALQMLVATYARSFKEAQNYIQLLIIVPTVPGIFLTFSTFKPALWMMAVPTLGQQLLINSVIRGETPPLTWFLLGAAAALLGTAVALAVAMKLLRKEQIIFGRG